MTESEDTRNRAPGNFLELANGGGVLVLDPDAPPMPRAIRARHREPRQLEGGLPDSER